MADRVCSILSKTSISNTRCRVLKNCCRNLSKGFVPNEVEQDVSSFWNNFSPHPIEGIKTSKQGLSKFSMVLPPPNVTGTLHLGHALTTTLQDVLTKRMRMKGHEAVWVPGLDHAGIATQAIVELVLSASGQNSSEMSREALLEQIFFWKDSKSEIILNQLKLLAPSLDWSRLFFTLDQNQSEAVREAFSRLYRAGLIYRAERLVNWSVKLGSAISDMEVEYKQIDGPTQLHPPSAKAPVTFGQMTDIAFKLQDRPGDEVIISTCRVETMPGDVAVAVHPEDSRYLAYHRCLLIHPLTAKPLPLILDSAVDPTFGTGAVKVTPGHDQADFEMAQRHGLNVISIIDETGTLNNHAGIYAGLDRFEAREIISDHLRQSGHIKQVRDHQMSIPICSRTKDIIELLSKPQWFLKCNEMGLRALEAVEKGHLQIIPDQHTKIWCSYLQNIRDWCISRQVVWGHRIPLYSVGKDSFILANSDISLNDESLHQVKDVLDTWFSSALLPFSAFGWPHNEKDCGKYFPLDLMVTGHDILFFWVARMVMLSLQLTDKLPFKKVLLHSVICDPQGRKMSKSLGNVIDPQHIIKGISHQELLKDVESRVESGALGKEEAALANTNIKHLFPQGIPQCGTDALRMTLLSHRIKNHYIHFDTGICNLNKHFCNKLWQACKFTSHWCSKLLTCNTCNRPPVPGSKLDLWILGKLRSTVATVNKSMDEFDFHIAVNSIKEFTQQSFCDVYLESVKSTLKDSKEAECREICYILLYSLVNVIKLLAPIAPFLTEKLFQHLQPDAKISVHHSDWPLDNLQILLPSNIDMVNEEITTCLSIVTEIRRLKLTSKETKFDINSVGLSLKQDLSSDLIELIENLSSTPVQIISQDELNKWCQFSALNKYVSIFYTSNKQMSEHKVKYLDMDCTKLKKLEKELDKILRMRSHESYKSKVAESVQKLHSDKILRLETQIKQLKIQG